MLIFLDTEFTKFNHPDLISMGLVAEDGREFYAERTDYHRDDCSQFVRETVLPLLGRVPGAACSRSELTERVREWFGQLPEPATIIFDFETDWLLLAVAILGRPQKNPANTFGKKLHPLIAMPSRTRFSSRHWNAWSRPLRSVVGTAPTWVKSALRQTISSTATSTLQPRMRSGSPTSRSSKSRLARCIYRP